MNKAVWTVGLAVFTMFFGAGNMVLPLMLSQKWLNEWPLAFCGFLITGVIVTFFGLIAAVLCGKIKDYFTPLGVVFGLLMQLVLISIEGPFGVVPRSMIVAFGGVKSIFPELSNMVFYAISCISLFFLARNKMAIVTVIGQYLTPLMLAFLSVLVISTAMNENTISGDLVCSSEAFRDGLLTGYLTYDLPGAIYFTGIAISYLKAMGESKKSRLIYGIKASMISGSLLIIVYASFVYLGLSYSDLIADVAPEHILPTIVKGALGPASTYIFAGFVVIACLTTAVAAITIWTDFIFKLSKEVIPRQLILAGSLLLAFVISTLDFMGLMHVLSPVLNILYPILIILTFYNISIHLKDIIQKS
jgi:branched-chain amino acid:cation transporter, LIVCS family